LAEVEDVEVQEEEAAPTAAAEVAVMEAVAAVEVDAMEAVEAAEVDAMEAVAEAVEEEAEAAVMEAVVAEVAEVACQEEPRLWSNLIATKESLSHEERKMLL
jgi:hypothetical protein